MKNLKKIMAVLIAAVMVFAMGITVFGATITITHQNGATPDANATEETYHAYKILDAVFPENFVITDDTIGDPIDTTVSGFQYTIDHNSPWFNAVKNSAHFYVRDPEGAGPHIVTLKDGVAATEATAKAIAQELSAYTVDKAATGGINYDYALNVGTANTVADGYYIILSSLGENAVVVTGNVDIHEKNQFPTIDKEEKDADLEAYIDDGLGADDAVNVAVGDVIDYKVEVFVPTSANSVITVTDTMSAGLTFNSTATNAITAAIGNNALTSGWEIKQSTASGWKIEITPTTATKGQTIVFSFQATVNDNAVVTDTTKANAVKLQYSNFEQNDSVPYELKATGAYKYDGASGDPLEGVTFELKENEVAFNVTKPDGADYYIPGGNSNVVTTNAAGKILIRGLDNKTYTLSEKDPLPGYNKLNTDVTLTLVPDTGTYNPDVATLAQIENNKGTELPSTGGIGTTIFYIIGGCIVLAAVIFLVIRSKKSSSK